MNAVTIVCLTIVVLSVVCLIICAIFGEIYRAKGDAILREVGRNR